MVYILLAPGFEEAEALVPADLLAPFDGSCALQHVFSLNQCLRRAILPPDLQQGSLKPFLAFKSLVIGKHIELFVSCLQISGCNAKSAYQQPMVHL